MDGVDWTDAIGAAIDSCAAIVCVIDPKYVKSTFCLDELSMAKSNGLSIFPLIFGAYRDTPVLRSQQKKPNVN